MKELKTTINQILVELRKVQGQIKSNPDVVYKIIDNYLVPKGDFEVMSRLVLLGNWNKLSKSQQQDFIHEFKYSMIRTYGVAFESYDGETIDFHCPVKSLPGGTKRYEVKTIIHHNKQPDNTVSFRILENPQGKLLVYDLIVDSISIVRSYRNVYTEKFAKKAPAEIIAEMHKKNCERAIFCKKKTKIANT